MTNPISKRLLDALLACRAIRQFTEDMDFSAYDANLLVQSAVERQFENIGEALGRAADADPTLVERFPDLRSIVGLRNRIIHGYDSVDQEILWDIVQSKMPALEVRITEFLAADDCTT